MLFPLAHVFSENWGIFGTKSLPVRCSTMFNSCLSCGNPFGRTRSSHHIAPQVTRSSTPKSRCQPLLQRAWWIWMGRGFGRVPERPELNCHCMCLDPVWRYQVGHRSLWCENHDEFFLFRNMSNVFNNLKTSKNTSVDFSDAQFQLQATTSNCPGWFCEDLRGSLLLQLYLVDLSGHWGRLGYHLSWCANTTGREHPFLYASDFDVGRETGFWRTAILNLNYVKFIHEKEVAQYVSAPGWSLSGGWAGIPSLWCGLAEIVSAGACTDPCCEVGLETKHYTSLNTPINFGGI